MESNGACEKCKGSAPDDLAPIGEPVRIESSVGRGYDLTAYSFAQCRACGSIWTLYRDSGAGGHGSFQQCLTKNLF
jgi:hypothetical protein